MKTCTKCGLSKPLDEYYIIKKSRNRHGSCKACFKKCSAESSKKLGKRHKRSINLKRNYGITIEDFDQMHDDCNGQCICGATKGRSNSPALFVDHCHDTGKIRGLLCHKCNSAIGLVEDPDVLRKLADYIELANTRSS